MVDIPAVALDRLEEHNTIARWMRRKEPSTRYTYLRCMVTFSRLSHMDPDQFLAWAKTVDSVDVQDRIDSIAEQIEGPGARFNFSTSMRSFLHTNGYNSLPKTEGAYRPQEWHGAYTKEQLRKVLGYLDDPLHKLYVYAATESGFRAQTVLEIQYHHIKRDFEEGIVPAAVRLEPSFYGIKKSAGYTFLGKRSISFIQDRISKGLLEPKEDPYLIPLSYSNVYKFLRLASEKAGVDKSIQVSHGIRKYFENALDDAHTDHEKKMMIEGHFEGTRAKSYTDREWDNLRPVYMKAYPFVDIDAGDPELEAKIVDWQEEKRKLIERIFELEQEKKNRNSEIEDIRKELAAIRRDMEKQQ